MITECDYVPLQDYIAGMNKAGKTISQSSFMSASAAIDDGIHAVGST